MGTSSGWWILLSGLLGLIVGVGASFAFRHSERSRYTDAVSDPSADSEPVLDDGIVRVLAVVRSAVIVLAHGDEVIRASAAAYALGLVRGEALVHERLRDIVMDVRRTGDIADEELDLPRGSSGHGRLVLAVRVAHLNNDFVVIFADDRTQARRVEEIRQDFAVNVSHELKTPVGAIALLAETLEDAADDPTAVRRFAKRTRQEAQRLAALVHDIIELSRLQGAAATLEATVVSADEVVREAIDRARTVATARHHEIIEPELSKLSVYGDYDLLVTAVRNLVDNAVAYSHDGTPVRIAIRTSGGFVEFVVLDEGVGITAEQRERIFERFYRADPARARDTGGTGLGLSIVKHVALDHGGEVTVWSEPGRGSTFTLRIPEAVATQEDPTRTHHNEEDVQ